MNRDMNRIDPKLAATLRQPAELIERGLAKPTGVALMNTFWPSTSTVSPGRPATRLKNHWPFK